MDPVRTAVSGLVVQCIGDEICSAHGASCSVHCIGGGPRPIKDTGREKLEIWLKAWRHQNKGYIRRKILQDA